MDTSVNNVVAQSRVMQQAQMPIFRAALDTQQQVTALVESASAEPRLAQDGSLGTRINTYAWAFLRAVLALYRALPTR